MPTLIEDYIAKLRAADTQLEQILFHCQEPESHYKVNFLPTLILDRRFRSLYVNLAARRNLGLKRGLCLDNIGIDSLAPEKYVIENVFSTGNPARVISHIPSNQTHGEMDLEWIINPLYDEYNNIKVVIATATDITERIAIESEQQKQIQLYKNLVENLPDIVARHDRSHRYLFVNTALEHISGIAPSQLIGKTFDNIGLPETSWKPWRQRCDEVFETGKIVTFDTDFPSPKGKIKVETILKPELDSAGNIETILAVCRLGPRLLQDALAELEHANNELKKQKSHLATMLENIPLVICRLDKSLRPVYRNPAAEQLYTSTAENCMEVALPFHEMYEKVFLSGQFIEFDAEVPNTNGETASYQTIVVPELDDNGQVQTVLSIAQDITTRKKLESEISRLDRMNIIGEMAASIGHEVRNPLTTVRGYLQFFQKKTAFIEFHEHFQTMIDELDRANHIITEFLSLAKNKSVAFTCGSLNNIIDTLFPLIQADALRLGHNVEMEKGDIPDINFDEKELRQLLLNLTRNSFDAMKGIRGKLTIQSYRDGNSAVLAIRDTGNGIPQEIIKKLGTPFLTTKDDGIGLGLAICYRIAQRHEAKIDVQTSTLGTSFLISFPAIDKYPC